MVTRHSNRSYTPSPSPTPSPICRALRHYDSNDTLPTITAITEPLPIRRSGTAASSKLQTIQLSYPSFCGIPLSPPKRRLGRVKLSSFNRAPVLPDPVPDPCKRPLIRHLVTQPRTTAHLKTFVCPIHFDGMTHDSNNDDHNNQLDEEEDDDDLTMTPSDDDDDNNAKDVVKPEIIRTRDSDVHHIAQLRASSALRPRGYWRKLSSVSLTMEQRERFNLLRHARNTPILRSEVISSRQGLRDDRHKSFLLQSPSHTTEQMDEYWDVDPFTDLIHLVEWTSSDAHFSQPVQKQEKKMNRRPWSIYSALDIPKSSSVSLESTVESHMQTTHLDELSTIRLVK